jgi:exodeoxyribonuclease-3
MKILNWNINSIRAILKKKNIYKDNNFIEYLIKENADIYCFSEVKLCLKNVNLNKLIPLEGYYKYFNTCHSTIRKGSYSGVLVLTKIKPININIDLNGNNEGRFIHLEYEKFNLVNVYVPNSGQNLKRLEYRINIWDKDLLNKLIELKNKKSTIITGDFNSIQFEKDTYNFKAQHNKLAGVTDEEINNFKKILNNGYINVFRELYPNKIQYSYFTYRFKAREHNMGLLIDFFLITKDLKNKIKDIKYKNNVFGSDHIPLLLEIDI